MALRSLRPSAARGHSPAFLSAPPPVSPLSHVGTGSPARSGVSQKCLHFLVESFRPRGMASGPRQRRQAVAGYRHVPDSPAHRGERLGCALWPSCALVADGHVKSWGHRRWRAPGGQQGQQGNSAARGLLGGMGAVDPLMPPGAGLVLHCPPP